MQKNKTVDFRRIRISRSILLLRFFLCNPKLPVLSFGCHEKSFRLKKWNEDISASEVLFFATNPKLSTVLSNSPQHGSPPPSVSLGLTPVARGLRADRFWGG